MPTCLYLSYYYNNYKWIFLFQSKLIEQSNYWNAFNWKSLEMIIETWHIGIYARIDENSFVFGNLAIFINMAVKPS
jgi:hypothetical protein